MKTRGMRNLMIILLGLATVFNLAAPALASDLDPVTIDLPESGVVRGNQMLLGEIGKISGAPDLVGKIQAVSAGTAPLIGYTRRLTLGQIEVRLRQAGIDLDRVVFEGAGTVQVHRLQSDASKDQDFGSGNGCEVVVARRDLARGEILSGADLEIEQRDGPVAGWDGSRPEDFIGLRTTRYLAQGTVLKSQNVETVPVVERGAQVTIVVRTASICVTVPGIARGSGGIGDLISVENTVSRKTVHGVIADKNTVQVGIRGFEGP